MKSPNRLSTSYLNIIQKLVVAKGVYQHVRNSLSDVLLKSELRRIVLEKEIFIKDFKTINGFVINDFKEAYGEDMQIEEDNLRLKFDHLIITHDEKGIVSLILAREQELSDLYYAVLPKVKDDQFIYMLLKNQLDETTQSISELKDLRYTFAKQES